MDIELIRQFCLSLPSATEDIKWGNDLCFSVAGKMFCVCGLNPPLNVSLKVRDDEFDELCMAENISPAQYVGRYKWISIKDILHFSDTQLKHYIGQSYDLISQKLSKKVRENL